TSTIQGSDEENDVGSRSQPATLIERRTNVIRAGRRRPPQRPCPRVLSVRGRCLYIDRVREFFVRGWCFCNVRVRESVPFLARAFTKEVESLKRAIEALWEAVENVQIAHGEHEERVTTNELHLAEVADGGIKVVGEAIKIIGEGIQGLQAMLQLQGT
ncbi:hypothetical protein AAVH_29250, partial [Aphelenchoides avenae]